MNIQIKTYNTLPSSKDHWWQIVLFPTVSIMNNVQRHDPYIAINIEYLFWSLTTIINHGKKQAHSYTTR
jgi:hypothetical protein